MSSLDPLIIRFYSFNGRSCVPLEVGNLKMKEHMEILLEHQSNVEYLIQCKAECRVQCNAECRVESSQDGFSDPNQLPQHLVTVGPGGALLWCGMVWCGMVWCGMVWYGVVWCGMVWYAVV